MKRLLSFCLAWCMLGALLPSAMAAEQDEQLKNVTALVKQQLHIDAQYEQFYGELEESELESLWNLHWSTQGESIDVRAKQDGTVLSYYHHAEDGGRFESGFSPSLPDVNAEQVQKAAQAFLDRVLRAHETAVFSQNDSGVMPLAQTDQYVSGTIYYDGLPTPIQFSIDVRASDLAVERYSRLEETRIGGVPAKTPAVDRPAAEKKLKDAQHLQLQYTTQTADGKPSRHAALRYVPQGTDEFYVDAQTGEMVNITALQEGLSKSSAYAENAAASGGAESGLTQAEQAGADKLQGVLAKEALDAKLKAMGALGLSGFTLHSASYRIDRDTGEVSAALYYRDGNGDQSVIKYMRVNAKTGALQSLYTTYPSKEDRQADTSEAAKRKAEIFLKDYETEAFSISMLLERNAQEDFLYVQQENQYPFPENYMRVGVSKNGVIDHFLKNWDDAVTFDAAEGLITAEAAQDSYYNAHQTVLGYVAVPVALEPSHPLYKEYISRGYTYINTWKLAYTAEQERVCYGVDAKTGAAVFREKTAQTGMDYTDLDAQQYPQAAALAAYGIGYAGGALRPEEALTQESLVQLLLSADGYSYDAAEDKAREKLYETAYNRGILTRAEYAPESTLTRAAVVKMLISSTGYGKTAELPGIYRCAFRDEQSIPAAYYGYVATAQGMGLIRGDESNQFLPNDTATRAQAIIILYNFMSR